MPSAAVQTNDDNQDPDDIRSELLHSHLAFVHQVGDFLKEAHKRYTYWQMKHLRLISLSNGEGEYEREWNEVMTVLYQNEHAYITSKRDLTMMYGQLKWRKPPVNHWLKIQIESQMDNIRRFLFMN